MLTWYQDYDKETFKQKFSNIDYARFDPLEAEEADNSIFTRSPAQDHVTNQFRIYQKANKPLRVQDPMSQLCIEHTIKQLSMIYTMFETESLLNESDYISEYRKYCA